MQKPLDCLCTCSGRRCKQNNSLESMSVKGISPVRSVQSIPGGHQRYEGIYHNVNTSNYSKGKLTDIPIPRTERKQAVIVNKGDANTSTRDGDTQRKSSCGATQQTTLENSQDLKPSRIRRSNSNISGGINAVSKSKVVLRRWTSSVSDADKTKRHSASLCEGNNKDKKNYFRPVSSILLSTPWEKDFIASPKSNAGKTEIGEENQGQDLTSREKENTRVRVQEREENKSSNTSIENCLLNGEISDPNRLSENKVINEKASPNIIAEIPNFHISNKSVSYQHEQLGEHENKATSDNHKIAKRFPLNSKIPQTRDNKRLNNCSPKYETATPAQDNDRPADFKNDLCGPTANCVTEARFIGKTDIIDRKNMPLSTTSSYYRSKYDKPVDVTRRTSIPSTYYRKSDLPAGSRTTPRHYVGGVDTAREPTSASSYAAREIKELDESVKNTVQEVDAYIQAYKSRRERGFERRESNIYSPTPCRIERKSSVNRTEEITNSSHSNRSYTPSYTSQQEKSARYSTQYQKSLSSRSEKDKRLSFLERTEKDPGYNYTRRTNYYSTITDRSKSSDIEANYHQKSLTPSESGERYARRTLTHSQSESNSQSPSRKYSASSDEIACKKSDVSHSRRVPSSESEKDKIPTQKSLDTVLSPGESSRSRIMGGILSRFFQDGESNDDVVRTSPSLTSESGSQAPSQLSKNGQLVKVRSSFVHAEKFEDKERNMGAASSNKDNTDKKEVESEQSPTQAKERRSSWLRRSLRSISSPSRPISTPAAVEETNEKPKRERRRSLLWRLGRESKSFESDVAESENTPSRRDVIGCTENKEKKIVDKTNTAEEKGISGYLRRSSWRRRNQSTEKEVVEKGPETSAVSRDKDTVENQSSHNSQSQLSQSQQVTHSSEKTDTAVLEESFVIVEKPTELETGVESKSDVKSDVKSEVKPDIKPDIKTDVKSAPLAEVEHSDEEDVSKMSQVTDGTSQIITKSLDGNKFADVLRKKEQARKAASKSDLKTGSSYLSSRFMKSKNIFENTSDDKSSVQPRKAGSFTLKDSRTASIDQKRAAFQRPSSRSKTIDIVTPKTLTSFDSKVPRNSLKDSSKSSSGTLQEEASQNNDKSTNDKSTLSTSLDSNVRSRELSRRATTDSIFKPRFARDKSGLSSGNEQVKIDNDEKLRAKSDYGKSRVGFKEDKPLSEDSIAETNRRSSIDKQTGVEKTHEGLARTGKQSTEEKLADKAGLENKLANESTSFRRRSRDIFGVASQADERKNGVRKDEASMKINDEKPSRRNRDVIGNSKEIDGQKVDDKSKIKVSKKIADESPIRRNRSISGSFKTTAETEGDNRVKSEASIRQGKETSPTRNRDNFGSFRKANERKDDNKVKDEASIKQVRETSPTRNRDILGSFRKSNERKDENEVEDETSIKRDGKTSPTRNRDILGGFKKVNERKYDNKVKDEASIKQVRETSPTRNREISGCSKKADERNNDDRVKGEKLTKREESPVRGNRDILGSPKKVDEPKYENKSKSEATSKLAGESSSRIIRNIMGIAKDDEIKSRTKATEEASPRRKQEISKKADDGESKSETSTKASKETSPRRNQEISKKADDDKSNSETSMKPIGDASPTSSSAVNASTRLSDLHLTPAGSENEGKHEGDRTGPRRRRERRAQRAKAVDPLEIAQIKEQMRSDSAVKDKENISDQDVSQKLVDVKGMKSNEITKDFKDVKDTSSVLDSKRRSVKDSERHSVEDSVRSSMADPKLSVKHETANAIDLTCVPDNRESRTIRTDSNVDKQTVDNTPKKKISNREAEDEEESSSSSSGPKVTTRSVIKEKIRQKKNTKHRALRAMSLPLGVNVVITPPTEDSNKCSVKEKLLNGSQLPVKTSKPPVPLPKQRSQEADDISTLKKKTKRPIRSRPKTLTQGIDPGLLLSDIKLKEEAAVVEEKLSISEIKQRLMRSETSGSQTPKTPTTERKNKRRSGKRYKTITEGIAPGILQQAHQYASNGGDPNLLGVDHMNKLNLALTASTENLKRRSFIVSDSSRVGSKGASLATSVEDLSMKDFGNEKSDSIVESIKKLKKLPMAVASDDEEEQMPSVSSLKQRFMQAVEDSNKAPKNKVVLRQKRGNRDRPFTISGIDDLTLRKIQIDIDERRDNSTKDPVLETKSLEKEDNRNGDARKDTSKRMDVLSENELEEIMEAEGLTADQLAAQLGINPSLSRGSPLRARKPFLGSTTEESVVDVLEIIEEKPEKQTLPLGNLRQQFLSAMTEFKGGSNDEKEADNTVKVADEKQGKVGIVVTSDKGEEKVLEGTSDWDAIFLNTSQLQSMTDRRHLKPQRRQRSSANPLKSLQARDDLISEEDSKQKTVENKKNEPKITKGLHAVSQKSLGQQLWRKVALASEAKAALQVTEDYSKVKLKKVKEPGKLICEGDDNGGVKQSSISNVLLKIKGRRHVQTNIADFSTSSLNDGDSFVIVTPKELFCWYGRYANVIEKAKAAEVASRINQKKEMGCKAFDVVYFEQGGQNEGRVFRTLGADGKVDIKECDVDDEEYEKNLMIAYMAYRFKDSDPPELVPAYEMCQRAPSKDMLKTDEAYVFDFLSEVYVWIGRQTTSSLRKKIMTLAREKFDQGYYKPPTSNLTPHHHGKSRKISLTATELPLRKQNVNRKMSVHKFALDKENLTPRPPNSIFLSMFEQAEWVMFKEKFCDWPDESRIIRMKGGPQTVGELHKKVEVADIKTVDPSKMIPLKVEPHLPVFESTEIDRGQGKPKGPDGYHIVTRNIKMWHVTEGNRTQLPESSHGHFHSGEGYVIRWEYTIVASRLMKMLKDMDEAKTSGRQKCAYFFWLGNDCAITEQGATAHMTVDLDEEKGPQVRVLQGKEPPCFLNLFEGGMIVHAGKRQCQGNKAIFSDRSVVRFYCVRNEFPNEASLLQVPVTATSLRSRSSFVLVLCNQAELFLWHGCKASEAIRKCAVHAAHRLIENHPDEAALSEKSEIFLTEIEEGNEPEVFWVALGGEEEYGSLLLDVNIKWDFVPRCFHMTSNSGVFIANEITNPSTTPKEKCPFPFLQDDLYDAYQPAIFIIDAIHEVYLWLGWWPEDEEKENSDAQRLRWDMLKRKAMESAILYAQEAGRSLSQTYVVDAGLEPDQFTHLFPYWIVQEDITDIQLEDGREDADQLQLITKKLEDFKREFYSFDELRRRPLPEGVNPAILETYLSDEDFQEIFKMDRNSFKKLPNWKQVNLKKRSGLY